MGFLDKKLQHNRGQVISCDDTYNYILKVHHLTGIDQITAADSDLKVSLYVKEMVPDVEEWQYGGDINAKYIFKFHLHRDRENVKRYLESLGYPTESRDFIK